MGILLQVVNPHPSWTLCGRGYQPREPQRELQVLPLEFGPSARKELRPRRDEDKPKLSAAERLAPMPRVGMPS